ncbi:hypothetical protein [Alkalihalobacterium alkalinitrilicum]|uniref:hypothetical protein n=1 Tax=Alkalihalobacterium alkalinitrilicum TaxID=427920 RepID=UPI001EE3CB7A|nr:hypothetical protein [Alkalihalobacterium alkalinitrilicum]
MTTPGYKIPYRIIDSNTGKFKGDYVALQEEDVKSLQEIELNDVRSPEFKNKVIKFQVKELLKSIYIKGQLVYEIPSTQESRNFHKTQLNGLWDEYKRKDYPEKYSVTYSDPVLRSKIKLIEEKRRETKKIDHPRWFKANET